MHLGERQRRTYFADGKSVATKKLFYALRPAAALRWLRVHRDAPSPPMHFPTLMAKCDPPLDVTAMTTELIAWKAETGEQGEAPLPVVIARFVAEEFAAAKIYQRVRFIQAVTIYSAFDDIFADGARC